MSGAWAREADNAREHMLGRADLAAAAWYPALAHVAGANSGPGAWNLRHAEAALRTLHARGRS